MRRAVLLSLLLALPAVPARADPIIVITGGSLDMAGRDTPFGPLVLQGTHNFSANAFAEVQLALGFGCEPCAPGTSIDLGTFFSELGGTAMVDGMQANPNLDLSMSLNLRFAGATPPVPPIGAEALLSAPFTVVGSLNSFDFPQAYQVVGRGTAMVHLVPSEEAGLWRTDRVHYDFGKLRTETPEPTSVVLLGSGLAGLVVRARRRRTQSRR